MIASVIHAKRLIPIIALAIVWFVKGAVVIAHLLSFREIYEMERRKQKELHDAGLDRHGI
ncbi:MAG: hypothetical protein JWO06_1370 [Bacteroidota bacterium]|nr:hypothetical protein [Bacteroidota bacterium]